jgi:AAA family ATP:ADP antiporter
MAMPDQIEPSSEREAGPAGRALGWVLSPFARVSAHEAVSAALLSLNGMILLGSCYLLKVAREPLVLTAVGAEVKSYLSACQGFLLIACVLLYDRLCRRHGRLPLLAGAGLLGALGLVVLAVLAAAGVDIGVALFLWAGLLNVVLVAQYWSLAADIYDAEQGARLFALLGAGTSLGAIAGTLGAAYCVRRLGLMSIVPLAAGLLVVYVALVGWLEWRLSRHAPRAARPVALSPIGGQAGLRLLAGDGFLATVALLTLLLNCVATVGEYILDRQLLAHGGGTAFVADFRATFFVWVSFLGLGVQLVLVSRALRFLRARGTLLTQSVLVWTGYLAAAVMPTLGLFTSVKVAEASTGYSLGRTAREALYLTTSRQGKYQVKTAIDTLCWRFGDVLGGLLVLLGSRLGLDTRQFMWLNLGLATVWVATAAGLWLQREGGAEVPERPRTGGAGEALEVMS